jgi:ribosomal protein L11 methyltransferase
VLWCEIRLTVPLAQVEVAAEVLRSVAPAGVSIHEPVVPLGPEEGVRLERHRPATVSCYLLVDDGLGARLDRIDELLAARGIAPSIETRRVDDAEWADAWKEHFHVLRVGRRTVIRPSWREYAALANDVVIDLDPGMAFGTGQHETTRGCLAMIEEYVQPGARVLDAGTGSGILAIAAVKLGAGAVLAVDVEPQAVIVASENAERNGVSDRIQVAQRPIDSEWLMEPSSRGAFDLVVANIHARVLIEQAPILAAVTAGEGVAILSGVIAEREDDVRSAYRRLGFTWLQTLADGEWRTMALRNKAESGA